MKNTVLSPARSLAAICTLFLFQPAYSQVVEGVDYSDRANVSNTFDMTGTDIFGQRFASENLTITDPETGVKIIALTTSRHHSSKIYQDHPSWTPDGKYIVFRSDRSPEGERGGLYYAVSMENYEIVQVTTGGPVRGMHLGWKKNLAYYFRGNRLVELKLGDLLADSEEGKVGAAADYERVIATVPEGISPSGTGLDADEDRMFFSSRLGEDSSAVYSIDFRSGKTTRLLGVPFKIGHFQANPWVSGEVMYCWETGGDAPQRIWYLSVDENGKVENRPLYKEKDKDWVTHEVFADADHILFNVMGHLDRLQKNPTGIFLLNIRTNEFEILGQAEESGGYWHSAGTKDLKWVVGDTFDGRIYRLNTEDGTSTPLTAGHRPNSKSPFTSEAHAHQSISPDGKWVLFNSSMLTESNIMMVPLQGPAGSGGN